MSDNTDLPPLPTLATGMYQHHKGNLYRVLGVARHSETLAPMVVYQPIKGDGAMWARPFDMFVESVEVNGVQIPRFKRLET